MTLRFLIPCFSLLLAGCPEDTTPPDNDTGSRAEPPSINLKECDGSTPCGTNVVETNTMVVWGGEVYTTEEYTCLLQALLTLAQDPELVSILLLRNDGGDSVRYTDMAIGYGDGTVLISEHGYVNMGDSYSDPPERCQLKDASFYQGCIDTPDVGCVGVSALVNGCTAEAEPACPVP